MAEEQNRAVSQGHLSVDQLQQELHAKELVLEALRYENNRLREHSDRHYDPPPPQDWKSYDTLKNKVVEYQTALEQRDHIIGQMEAGIKQLMHQNLEAEAKGRKAEEHYSGEIQTLAQQVQELTAQLSLTTDQHQATMRATQEHFMQQLAASKQQMREKLESECAVLREQHASEMKGVTLQMETLEKSKNEEYAQMMERLTQHSNTLGNQLEEEKEKLAGLLREKEEWEVYKKELEAEIEEKESLRRNLDEQTASREDLQEKLRKQVERQMRNEERIESLQKASESLSQELQLEREKKKEIETKLEEEVQKSRKLFEQKTALEVNQEQAALQLLAVEEELTKISASREGDLQMLKNLGREKEIKTQENMALSKDKETLMREKGALTSEREALIKEKTDLLLEKQLLTKENVSLASKSELLTKKIEELTKQCETLTKAKEVLDSAYKTLNKEKEAITLESSRLLEGNRLKDKERENLLKEMEALSQAKETLTKERDSLLGEKEDSAREKDLWVSESEVWLTEKEQMLTERDNLILHNKNLISENKTLLQEKECLCMKVESLSSEKEVMLRDKEEQSTLIESLRAEREALMKEKHGLISEKQSWLDEKNALLQETDTWATEKENLLLEKETLLLENKSLIAEKEAWEKVRQSLSQQNEGLCQEREAWIQKEELLNKKNESLTTTNEALVKESKSLANEKLLLVQQNENLCQENKKLAEEKEDLMAQVNSLGTEQEHLVEQIGSSRNKIVELLAEKEKLTNQISTLQRERELLIQGGVQVKDAAATEVKSIEGKVEAGCVVRQQLEKCAALGPEKRCEERFTQTMALKESDWRDLQESYKEKYLLKEHELRELEENFNEKFSHKEKELGMYQKMTSEKDNELKELREKITMKEDELEKLKKREKGIEELHVNCVNLLERLQSGEEERKRVEEECEDKCEMLNVVLRSVDVKLGEAAALLSHQKPEAEQAAEPRRRGKETKLERRLKEELDHIKGNLEERGKSEGALREKLNLCEKEKKELCNEAERLESKIHEQHFIITSLQNEKLRLGQHIAYLEEERNSLRAAEMTATKANLSTQEELTALRVKLRDQEQKLELQEREMKKYQQALTEFLEGDAECLEKLRNTLTGLSQLGGSPTASEQMDETLWLSTLCQGLEQHWRHQDTYLDHLMDLQQHSDKLQQEKLQAELENISLRAELDGSRQGKTQADLGMDESVGVIAEGAGDQALELGKLRRENKLLQECLASNNVLLRHKKLQKLCPKPKFEREMKLRLLERRAVMQVVVTWLQRFVSQWKPQTQTHPSLTEFTEAFSSCVEDLNNHLLGTQSGSSTMNIEAAISSLQQAVIKVVSGEYQEAVSDTLKSLEEDLTRILHHISLPCELDTAQKQASETSQQPTENVSSPHEDSQQRDDSRDQHTSLQDLTARVEQLINVRTALVDAANELDEELEETIGQRVALLKEQLQTMLCSRETNQEVLPCLPCVPEHKAFIKEFTDFTSQVSQEAHSEKVQVLRSQQEMVHKILEDNQSKLRQVCQHFLGTVQGLTDLEELEVKVQSLVDSLESTLAKEVVWVEQQYRDLLEHYIQEQDTNSQACAQTCSHLIHTLTHLLQSVEPEGDVGVLKEEHSRETMQLQQKQLEKIQQLEAQLAAKDQEALCGLTEGGGPHLPHASDVLSFPLQQHLQGVYNDRDCYKKAVGLLSHVTLQLLHYYSVAQSLTHQPQQDPSSSSHPADFPSPGKVVDLSFRSDCGGEEGEMLAFSDDGVLATGLVGRTAFSNDGEAEDVESALDNTAVSEGMLDDFDKDEQVRTLLERYYPQLMALLKGRCDMVQVACLEKEIQELTISLQASAGMLKIFIHSVSSDRSDLSSHTLKGEVAQEESVPDSALETSHSQPSPESSDVRDESLASPDPLVAVQQAAKNVILPSRSVFQQDLSTISEGLIQLLSQEEALSSFTMLTPHDPPNKEQLKAVLSQLCEAAQASASLKLELHHARGLQQGLEEERHTLQEEVARLTHYNKNLARELQVLKDRLEETEGQEGQKPASKYAAKWESKKDIRERASAALTAKNAVQLGQEELEARVRELEVLLEEVVKESDTALEVLRARETDLTQQLEVADRQLKSARQFLEEHASERDQEVEELVAVRDKLTMQLREQEAQIALQGTKDKEICDLREIINSLESQADCRCMKEAELSKQVEMLSEALTQAQQEVQRLTSKVEELQLVEGKQLRESKTEESTHSVLRDVDERDSALRRRSSLLSELQEDSLTTSAVFQQLEKRLGDTTRGLEALQLSGSVEDISAQEVEVTVVGAEGRISPATVDRRLENQLMALERTTEAAIKRSKDLQLTIKNLQRENEEVSAERDTLQERSKEQLVKISGLEARLDEIRRADHPAVADLRQRLTLVQEDLEAKRAELTKKGREVEELKHSLSNLRAQLTAREGELQRLQSASMPQPQPQPGSLPPTTQDSQGASGAPSEEKSAKKDTTGTLKSEQTKVHQNSSLSPLAVALIKEKNAEISELTSKVKQLVCAVQGAQKLLKEGGSPAKAQQMLSHALSHEVTETLNETDKQEVLREVESEQRLSLGNVSTHTVQDTAAAEVSGELSQRQVEGSVGMQPSASDSSVMSTQTVPHSKPSETRLEEDFRSAQELLEAREAEIVQLSEEVEDSPPVPLTTLQSPSLNLKIEQLQQALYEVEVSKADCEVQLEQLSLKNKLCNEEMKQLQDNVNIMKQEAQHYEEQIREKEAVLSSLRQQLEDNNEQHGKEKEELSSMLRAAKDQAVQLSSSLQGKSDEVRQLSAQLDQLHTNLKEKLSQASREAANREEQLHQKISDLKEEHVRREKELCSSYEEHMAKQIRDLAERLSKEREAAMTRQQEFFEARLHQLMQEKEQTKGESERQSSSASPPAQQTLPQPQPSETQTGSQLCESVDALVAGLKNELEKSGQLDQSVAALMRANSGGEASTRASSALSDASEGEEPASVNGRIQHLMNKIHNEGIEVLTLIDFYFLCKHHTKLDENQRSLITSSSLLGIPPLEGGEAAAEQSRLLRNLAAVEDELAKKEQEMKSKIGALEFQLEQEKLSGSEWKLSYESEKQHTRDLMEQLRKERLTGAEQVSELTLLRSHVFILRLQHQKAQEENCSLSEGQKERDKQIENLQSALQAERNNFSRMSKVLSDERKMFGQTHTQQDNIIKDLRNTLEKERERIMALNAHLERLSSTQPFTSTARHHDTLNKSSSEELKIQLVMEKKRCVELERACERERLLAKTQKEQATAERAQSRAEMRETECKLSELTRTVRSLETEKERLVRQMSHERDLLQHQDSRIKELEGEVKRLKADNKAQSEAHQAMAQKMKEEGSQLHLNYTRTLTKLGEVEADMCELQHRVRAAGHELQLAREREEQLKQDLHTERTALDRLGVSALSRSNNYDEYAEVQLKQNLELCKSYLRLTDEQRTLRTRINELEDTVTSLTQQLLSAQAATVKMEEAVKAERQVLERERTSLQHLRNQWESEAQRTTHQRVPSAAEVIQLYGRYIQSEHQRKALVWQKRYLLVVIKGFRDTEQHTRSRLTAMVPLHLFPSTSVHHQARQSKGMFRVAGLVVVAMCRMRKLVQRFQKKMHHWEVAFNIGYSEASSPDSSRPQSCNSVVGVREVGRTFLAAYQEGLSNTSFTGLTPPTRGPTTTLTPRPLSASRRSLFQEDSSQLNQYVERLDNIHSVLGLTHRKQ